MTLTEIIERDPAPAPALRPAGPSTPLDQAILDALSCGREMALQEVTRATGNSTHKVHARIQSLVGKGMVNWIRTPGGPRRGPGASKYQIAP